MQRDDASTEVVSDHLSQKTCRMHDCTILKNDMFVLDQCTQAILARPISWINRNKMQANYLKYLNNKARKKDLIQTLIHQQKGNMFTRQGHKPMSKIHEEDQHLDEQCSDSTSTNGYKSSFNCVTPATESCGAERRRRRELRAIPVGFIPALREPCFC